MRLSTFLLGGIVGAATVVYLSRGSKATAQMDLSATGEAAGNVMNKAMNKAKDALAGMNVKSMFKKELAEQERVDGHDTWNKSASQNEIKDIINEDPELRVTVQEILTENGHAEALSAR